MLSSPADAGLRGDSPREKLPLFEDNMAPQSCKLSIFSGWFYPQYLYDSFIFHAHFSSLKATKSHIDQTY